MRLGLLCLVLAGMVLAGCASTTPRVEVGRVLMSGYQGWTIRVTPLFTEYDRRWRARVEVWPPDRRYETHPGISLRLNDSAPDEKAIVQFALASARRYIDASRPQHE